MRSNNFRFALFSLMLAAIISGCTTPGVRRAEPIKVELPEAQPQKRVFNEGTQLAFYQAVGLLRSGELESATIALEDLLEQQDDVPGAWYNLALIQYQQKQMEQAQTSLRRCVKLSPRYAPAYTLSGIIHRQQGEFEQARLAYAKALESDNNHPEAHLNMAILYDIYLGYLEDAKLHYQRFLELAPESPRSDQVKLWLQDLQLRINRGGQG